ncbi:MAG: NADH-quinone oxidoreductase subunit J [Dehalococcoidia bacterium]
MIENTGIVVAFWVLAVVTVGAAAMVILVRNLIHAVLFLVLSFMGIAGLYITLSADFVAVVQVLIYVGAISVLMLFAIMLTPLADRGNREGMFQAPAIVLAGLMAGTIAFVALDTNWNDVTRAAPSDTPALIGEALLGPFVLPFEIASVLLVAAMIGAILLAREE